MAPLLHGPALILGAFSAGFSLVALVCAWKAFRGGPAAHAALADSPDVGGDGSEEKSLPAVTILKPLKGVDRDLDLNLESFCSQDYPAPVQILLCLSDEADPAALVARKICRDHPDKDITVVISRRVNGSNPKISNLANAYSQVKHGLLILSDSDIRVAPDFLKRAVASFSDPKVGLASCFYRAVASKGLGGALETLSINAHFVPQAATASAFGMSFAMGAAILVRRSVFDAVGGFATLADHIADDFCLGTAVMESGAKVVHASNSVDSITGRWNLADHVRHQIREYRTVRICAPTGYLGTIFLHGFTAITLKTVLLGPDPLTLTLAGVILASKTALILLLGRPPIHALLIPLSEWLSFGYWVSGFTGSQVLWRGERYLLSRGGRLTPLAS